MSTSGRAGRRRSSARVRRRRALVATLGVVILVVVAGSVTAFALLQRGRDAAPAATTAPSTTETPTPTPTPLTPEEELLASTTDPAACAVSFAGEGIADPPMLQTRGALYTGLPIPSRDGLVFAGWYATPGEAAAYAVTGRVNGSDAAACIGRRVTLYAGWMSPEQNAAEDARIPILMYHQFTTKPEGESGWLRANYAYIGDFDAQMSYISTGGFYLPTWDELSAFIDGRLFLPGRSVIVTDDDADQTWFDLAAPVVEKYRVLATSFMITAYRQDPPPNMYVQRRSHTHDMHQAGADGKGRMVNWTVPEIVADLEASAGVLGTKQIMAYPFGHYNDTAKEALRQGGWEMARTIDPGYVTIGTDKLALPMVRMNYGMGLDALIRAIG